MTAKILEVNSKSIIKFLLLMALLTGYFIYLSQEYGTARGAVVTALTWSFFVLCTPIADGGFLLDFPIRIIFKVPMVHSEIAVWAIAIATNLLALFFANNAYESTQITRLLHHIVTTPYPYWAVIILSCMGTFLSLIFGDRLVNAFIEHDWRKIMHSHLKWELLGMTIAFGGIVVAYYWLLKGLDIHLV